MKVFFFKFSTFDSNNKPAFEVIYTFYISLFCNTKYFRLFSKMVKSEELLGHKLYDLIRFVLDEFLTKTLEG